MSIFRNLLRPLPAMPVDPPARGRIVSDGCRDYFAGIEQAQGTEMLKDRRGHPRRFASLDEAKQALRRANVDEIELAVRVAADEACAGSALQESGFAAVSLAQPAGS